MDAIIFFIGAVLVSNILKTYVAGLPSRSRASQMGGDTDPAEILRTILSTSLGESVLVDLGRPFCMDDRTTAAEFLAIELAALACGYDIGRFDHVNRLIHDILRSVSNPSFEPFLLVLELDKNQSEPVLSIPHTPGATKNAYASSTEIPGTDATVYLAVLVLCPALLPELV